MIIEEKNNIEKVKALLNSCFEENGAENYNGYKEEIDSYVSTILNKLIVSPDYCLEQLEKYEEKFENTYGQRYRVLANKIIVYNLYLENYHKIGSHNLPQEVVDYQKEDFERMIKLTNENKPNFLSLKNSQFYKYLETLHFKMLPIGNQGIILSGLSRGLLFKQPDLKSWIRFFFMVLLTGGNQPLYEVHYNPHRFRQFNPEGWDNVYSLAAKVLEKRSDIKGVFGGAWFFDPKLKEISPELTYLHDLVIKIGGYIYYMGRSDKDRKNAFALSAVRKKAYEEGRYNPAKYLAVIPRVRLLDYYLA